MRKKRNVLNEYFNEIIHQLDVIKMNNRKVEEIEKEEWKPIKGFNHLYEVSNMGDIRKIEHIIKRSDGRVITKKTKVLKQTLNHLGYPKVWLYNGAHNGKYVFVHRLVFEAFKNPIPFGWTINHINHIRTDNRLTNLECIRKIDNIYYSKPLLKIYYHGKYLCDLPSKKAFCQLTNISQASATALINERIKEYKGYSIKRIKQF